MEYDGVQYHILYNKIKIFTYNPKSSYKTSEVRFLKKLNKLLLFQSKMASLLFKFRICLILIFFFSKFMQ